MSWSFNVFSGTLDQTGSGAVVFEGEVETFADLPETVGEPAVGSSYLVRTSTGVWLVNRKQAGIWIRRNNTGVRDTDWGYGGDYPVNSVNGQSGNVVLAAADVGASAIGHTHAASDITSGLAAVATSGSYADLSNKPTLGTAAAAATTDFDPAGTAASAVSTHAGKTDGTAHTISGISGLTDALAALAKPDGTGISEAPTDGKKYARKDAAWTEVLDGVQGPAGEKGEKGDAGATGSAGPAPSGTGFVTVTNGVLDTPSDAPSDGKSYARKDAGWAEVVSGIFNFPSDYDSFSVSRDENGNVTSIAYIKSGATIATATITWDTEATPNLVLTISDGTKTMTLSYDEEGNLTGGSLN